MSSSDGEASAEEEKWDDMAIVRAFEDAMQGQRREKKAAPTELNGQQSSRKVSSRRKQSPGLKRTAAETNQWNATTSDAPDVNSHQSAAHPQPFRAQSQEEIYRAAYAQAYAHLQAQWQPGYHFHHQHASTPSYLQQHGGYSFPSQWAGGMPAGIGLQAPAPPAMPFPSAAGGAPPVFSASAGVQDDLANLLMSWYQSGYHTGRYQAMQEMKTKGPR